VPSAHLALGVVFAAVFLFFCVSARFGVLYKDDWDWIAPLLRHVPLRDYVLLIGNEHIGVIPRALMWLDYRLNGVTGPLTWTVGLAGYLLTAAVLVEHEYRRADLSADTARFVAGATLALIFFTYQLQVFLSPAGVTLPLALALGVCAMTAMIRATRPLQRRDHAAAWLVLAACASLASVLASGQGLATPFALAAMALTVKTPRAMQVSLLGAALAAGWFYARATGVHTPAADAHAIGRMMLFGLAFLGGPLSYGSVAAGAALGAAALAVGINEAVVVARVARRERPASECQSLCVGIMVFVLINAVLTAAARERLGTAQAAQSRYALLAMLYLSCVLTLWTIRLSESSLGRTRLQMASRLTLVLMAAALPLDLFIGATWWAKAENVRAASLALRVRVPDFEWIRTVHPDPARPYEWSRLIMASDRPGFLSAGSGGDSMRGVAPIALPACAGELRRQDVDGGFRVAGRLSASSSATIVIEDYLGAVRGLVERAPLVRVPNPSYDQVIAAVWRRVRHPGAREPEWFGFGQRGAGPPYRAVVSDQGRAACAAPVDVTPSR
jgi:hypothetical protein